MSHIGIQFSPEELDVVSRMGPTEKPVCRPSWSGPEWSTTTKHKRGSINQFANRKLEPAGGLRMGLRKTGGHYLCLWFWIRQRSARDTNRMRPLTPHMVGEVKERSKFDRFDRFPLWRRVNSESLSLDSRRQCVHYAWVFMLSWMEICSAGKCYASCDGFTSLVVSAIWGVGELRLHVGYVLFF